jgi:menaquinone-dependent protoporphyrinogen oxidase
MSKRILVAYASGSGSTREVAAAIGEALAEGGARVDVEAVQDVSSVADYSALVVGSSIRGGRWLPEAVTFVAEFAGALAARPVAYFTTCLAMIKDTDENRRRTLAYMDPILSLAPSVMLVDIGLFAGSLDASRQIEIAGVPGPYGDYRDWEAIDAWAAKLLPTLMQAEADADAPSLRQASDLLSESIETPLFWSELADAELADANFEQGNLIGAHLAGADLSDARLSRAILNGSTLTNATLRGADLSGADLHWSNLRGADLRDANLQLAMLGWADLSDANLTNATLSLAAYNEFTRWPEGFSPDEAGCRYVGRARRPQVEE